MITISTPCCFAAYSSAEKKLESTIITIGEGTTIICNADEKTTKSDTAFFPTRIQLVTFLKSKNVKNADGTEITEDEI